MGNVGISFVGWLRDGGHRILTRRSKVNLTSESPSQLISFSSWASYSAHCLRRSLTPCFTSWIAEMNLSKSNLSKE